MKKCSKCNIDKNLTDFRKRSDSKDGHRNDCKSCSSNMEKKKRSENHDFFRKKEKKSYEKNKLKWKYSREKYRCFNIDKSRIYMKAYFIDNKDNLIIYRNEYIKKRKNIDPLFKLKYNIRTLILNSIKRQGFSKNSKSEEIIGCSFIDFKNYLESKFESWMCWSNYGKYNGELNYGWDIDHIIPISSASSIEEIIKLNHFTNIQPLCSYTNRYIKKDKYNYEN